MEFERVQKLGLEAVSLVVKSHLIYIYIKFDQLNGTKISNIA